jgi:hypothetical protein
MAEASSENVRMSKRPKDARSSDGGQPDPFAGDHAELPGGGRHDYVV